MGENWQLALGFGTFFTSFSSFHWITMFFFSLWGGKCSEESNFTLSEIMKTFFHWITKIWLFSLTNNRDQKISLVVGHTHLHCLSERRKKIAFFHSRPFFTQLKLTSYFHLWICSLSSLFFFSHFHSKSIYQNWPERISI